MQGTPDTRVQRTRSSPSPPRSPLMRCPLGDSRKVSQASSRESDGNPLRRKQAAGSSHLIEALRATAT